MAPFTNRRIQSGVQPQFYLLVILYGSCGWMSVNTTWVELPFLVNFLPEGWSLPSYLAVIVQLAVIGPILVALFRKFVPQCYDVRQQRFLIASIIACDVAVMLILSFTWHCTAYVAGATHSVVLFSLFFIQSLIDCTSNVLYLPYMYSFQPSYTTAYFIGLGLSGFIPSMLLLSQGAGKVDCVFSNMTNRTQGVQMEANFEVSAFYLIIALWLLLAFTSFLLLHLLPGNEKVRGADLHMVNDGDSENDTQKMGTVSGSWRDETTELDHEYGSLIRGAFSNFVYLGLLLLVAWISALINAVLPSIQSYSSLPYGQTVYQLCIVLSNVINPMSCFLTYWLTVESVVVITSLIGAATLVTFYIIFLASSSPVAILDSSALGPTLCVCSWVIVTGFFSFLKTTIATNFRKHGGQSHMFWYGISMQLGSFIAAVIMFPLVNYFRLFHSAELCK